MKNLLTKGLLILGVSIAANANIDVEKELNSILKEENRLYAANKDKVVKPFDKSKLYSSDKNNKNIVLKKYNMQDIKDAKESPDEYRLEELAKSKHNLVIYHLLQNDYTPEHVLSMFVKHKQKGFRILVAKNQNTSIEDLLILIRDKEPMVAEEAQLNLKSAG